MQTRFVPAAAKIADATCVLHSSQCTTWRPLRATDEKVFPLSQVSLQVLNPIVQLRYLIMGCTDSKAAVVTVASRKSKPREVQDSTNHSKCNQSQTAKYVDSGQCLIHWIRRIRTTPPSSWVRLQADCVTFSLAISQDEDAVVIWVGRQRHLVRV